MELQTVRMKVAENANLILGQTHFIKTVEDLYEVMVNTVPGIKFAIAFNEASVENAQAIGAGHLFVVLLRQGYPVNVLSRIKDCFEVCSIYCATANPVEVVVAQSEQGRGVLGVIDGYSPKGVESPADAKQRKEFLRTIGYKL